MYKNQSLFWVNPLFSHTGRGLDKSLPFERDLTQTDEATAFPVTQPSAELLRVGRDPCGIARSNHKRGRRRSLLFAAGNREMRDAGGSIALLYELYEERKPTMKLTGFAVLQSLVLAIMLCASHLADSGALPVIRPSRLRPMSSGNSCKQSRMDGMKATRDNGVRSVDLSRESSRHRSVPSFRQRQALPHGIGQGRARHLAAESLARY